MRCGFAQKLFVAAVDGEITPERRRDLAEHVAACAECRSELRATEALLGALGSLPQEAEVPPLVEAAILRRMRVAAAEERDRKERGWGWLPAPVLAAAGITALALAISLRPESRRATPTPAAPEATAVGQVARAPEPTAAPAAPRQEIAAAPADDAIPPAEPPPDLAAAPDLFMNLPIIRNMDKLEHFEAITMVELPPNG